MTDKPIENMRKKKLLYLKNILYYPLMIFCCFEIALRVLSYEPYRNTNYSVEAQPANAFVGHNKLGIQLNEGRYDITLNEGLTFQTTHLPNGSRYVNGSPNREKGEILMLGCSYTYGFGVNDDENFTSLLQKEFSEKKFHNAGVIGYGTVQSLMQLKEQVKSNDGLEVVLLNFSAYHFMRNTLSQLYRSHLKIGYSRSSRQVNSQMAKARFPFRSSCNGPIEYSLWEEIYDNWPGREWLASVNFFQTNYDVWQDDIMGQVSTTSCVIKEIASICEERDIMFGVVCLNNSVQTEMLKKQINELNWIDVGFSFQDQSLINHPYDEHPNAKGHQMIASKIEPFLKKLLEQSR